MIGNNLRIPHYLEAGSPRRLRQLMFENNILSGKEYTYTDIIFAKGKWYAWYYEQVDHAEAVKQELDIKVNKK